MSEPRRGRRVTIVYRRLPNDLRKFPGILRDATSNKLIIESTIKVKRPVLLSGNVVADTGFVSVWFVYRTRWYDIGKFYDRSRRWIGYYCDIIMPVKKLLANPKETSVITDLFLDLWISKNGHAYVLDEDELEQALKNRWISRSLAGQTRRRMRLLLERVQAGRFPPLEVRRIQPLDRST